MGETRSEALIFRAGLGLTAQESAEGATSYQATAHGVTYRVIGTIDGHGHRRPRRTFRAYRVTPEGKLRPAGRGGAHATRAAAAAQAQMDLGDLLADRAAVAAVNAQREVTCDGCGDVHPVAEMTHTRTVSAGSSESDYRCPACGPVEQERITTTTAARRDELTPAPRASRNLSSFIGAVERAVTELREQATARPAVEVDEFGQARIAENVDLPDLLCADETLMRRIVARAKYDALREVLRALDGWISASSENNRSLDYRDEDRPAGITVFDPDDIRRMVNDAAREVGTREPWRPEASA